jgi:hypothetical protein
LVKLASGELVAYEPPMTPRKIRKRAVSDSKAELTQKGKKVLDELVIPILSLPGGESRYDTLIRPTEPTEEQLIKAMELYAEGRKDWHA